MTEVSIAVYGFTLILWTLAIKLNGWVDRKIERDVMLREVSEEIEKWKGK